MKRALAVLLAVLMLGTSLAGCVDGSQDPNATVEGEDPAAGEETDSGASPADTGNETTDGETTADPGTIKIEQEPGNLAYWVLPGKRTLGEASWGTPEHPKNTLKEKLDDIRELPAPYNETVGELVKKVPIIAGLPMKARATNADNTSFTHTKMPTPVSNKGKVVNGSFQMTLQDRTPWDLATKFEDPTKTPDAVEATATFEDPAGNEYKLEADHLRQWTFQENGGGVITNGFIHGNTGVDSPLFPRAFTYGAFWGVGSVSVNGEVVHDNQWIHFMTTQIVRDADYNLVTQDELPLDLDDTIAGQPHHTHVIVRPVKETPDGPAFNPVKTAFELKPGKTQPFIHAMFEQDRILNGPFKDDPSDPWMQGDEEAGSVSGADVTVDGHEWALTPSNLSASPGEEITVGFRNTGDVAHNFAVDFDGDGSPEAKTDTIKPGQTAKVTVTAPEEAGEYAYFCSVSGHRDAGMEGTLTVQAS